MRTKLSLNLDQLSVDSFETCSSADERGTVLGQQCTCWTNCTCPGCPTCDHTACDQHSCRETCNTCHESCDSCYESCYGGTCVDTCAATCYWTCICV